MWNKYDLDIYKVLHIYRQWPEIMKKHKKLHSHDSRLVLLREMQAAACMWRNHQRILTCNETEQRWSLCLENPVSDSTPLHLATSGDSRGTSASQMLQCSDTWFSPDGDDLAYNKHKSVQIMPLLCWKSIAKLQPNRRNIEGRVWMSLTCHLKLKT